MTLTEGLAHSVNLTLTEGLALECNIFSYGLLSEIKYNNNAYKVDLYWDVYIWAVPDCRSITEGTTLYVTMLIYVTLTGAFVSDCPNVVDSQKVQCTVLANLSD